jgi:hypothetical protein
MASGSAGSAYASLRIELRNSVGMEELGLLRREWLGGRDSNPDNRVQSAVSYR